MSKAATATATLELRGLPTDGRPLLLSLHVLTSSAASDARTLYVRAAQTRELGSQRFSASPVILNITPILGILIGGVAALVLVAIIIVVVLRLRGHSGNDSKPKEVSASEGNDSKMADKTSTVPLSKDTDESIDSQEEKNPDVIPQKETDYQDQDEKPFAKLNNAPNRTYASITPHAHTQSPRIYDNSGNIMNVPKSRDEITYAELALPKQLPVYAGVQRTPSVVQHEEPTVYAQIDVSKQITPQMHLQQHSQRHAQDHPQQHPQMLTQPQQQTQQQQHQPQRQQFPQHHAEMLQHPQDGNAASASLPLLHHHQLAAAYTPHPHLPTLHLLAPPGPPGTHTAMTALGALGPLCPPDDDLPVCAETPLLSAPGQRESTV